MGGGGGGGGVCCCHDIMSHIIREMIGVNFMQETINALTSQVERREIKGIYTSTSFMYSLNLHLDLVISLIHNSYNILVLCTGRGCIPLLVVIVTVKHITKA